MNIADPTPAACAALLLAMPLCACAGADLAGRASSDRETRRIVTPAAAFALWLLCVCGIARAARSFLPGLIGGTLLCALLGVPYAVRAFRARRLDDPGASLRLPVVIFVALSTLAIFAAVRRYFHDEVILGGHISTVAQLENGYFPPRFQIFPQFEFTYHYGFDVAAAALAIMLRLPPTGGIDSATVLAWIYTGLLGCHLGRKLGGARHGILTGLLVLFGGGLHLGCQSHPGPLGERLTGVCTIDGLWVNPPLSSYFFQHPFGVGIPLFLAILALLADRASGPLRARYALFAVLFAALSQSQIVLFACSSASFLAAESLERPRLGPRRALSALAALIVALAAARYLGGFFAPARHQSGAMLLSHLGITSTALGTLKWHARSYGLLLPVGFAGLFLARGQRLFLALMVFGCLLVPNVVFYAHTWDIVKFTTAGELTLAVAAGCALSRFLSGVQELPFAERGARIALAAALVLPMIAWSATFHAAMWLEVPYTHFDWRPYPMSDADIIVAGRLRRLVPVGESVYRQREPSRGYGSLTGLPIVWADGMLEAFGFSNDNIRMRRLLLETMPPDTDAWSRQGIRWFVIDASERLLRSHAERWVAEGKAEIVFEVDRLRVVHLKKR